MTHDEEFLLAVSVGILFFAMALCFSLNGCRTLEKEHNELKYDVASIQMERDVMGQEYWTRVP